MTKIRFVKRSDSRLMRLANAVFRRIRPSAYGNDEFLTRFVTTLRLPFWGEVRMYTHDGKPPQPLWIYAHELVHAKDFAPWYGPWLMMAKFAVSRFLVEREAFLGDIRAGARSPEDVARLLKTHYFEWVFSERAMVEWFRAQIGEKQPGGFTL